MLRGEKLFRFLASLVLDKFYGTVIIRFESGKVTHVEAETRRSWEYQHLPVDGACLAPGDHGDVPEARKTRTE